MNEKIREMIKRWEQSLTSEEQKELIGVADFLKKQGLDERSFRFVTASMKVKLNILSKQVPLLVQALSMMIETNAIAPAREEFDEINKVLLRMLSGKFDALASYLEKGKTGAVGENKIFDIEISNLTRQKDQTLQACRKALQQLGVKTAGTSKEKASNSLQRFMEKRVFGFKTYKLISIPLILVVFGLLMVFLLVPPNTTKTHHGTANLFSRALMKRDVEKMKEYCVDSAVDACQPILDTLVEIEQSGKTSGLKYIDPWTGAVGEQMVSARLKLLDKDTEVFCHVDMNLKKTEEKRWKIYEMGAFPVVRKEIELASDSGRGSAGSATVMRRIANSLEEYLIDQGVYPPSLYHLTSPVAFFDGEMYDPFSSGELFHYTTQYDFWLLWSVGPDMDNDDALVIYDSTNGTRSDGDIVMTSP